MMSLGFLLINCGDKPEPQITCDSTNTAFLPQELLDRFFFNDGTWWVYHDLLTDLRDSVWLVRSSIGIGKEPELKKNCQQIASFNYKSSTGDAWLVTIQPQSVAGIDKFNDLNYKILYRNTIKNVTIFRFDYKKSIYQNPTEEGYFPNN